MRRNQKLELCVRFCFRKNILIQNVLCEQIVHIKQTNNNNNSAINVRERMIE